MNATCPFCLETRDRGYYKKALDETWPHPDRILIENDEAIAVPTIGPLIYPHALVISKPHSLSFLSSDESTRVGMLSLLDSLAENGEFGQTLSKRHDLLIFEHGGSSAGETSCQCIEHCHLQVCVGVLGLINWFREDRAHAKLEKICLSQPGSRDFRSYLFAGYYRHETCEIEGYIEFNPEARRHYFRDLLVRRLEMAGYGSGWTRKMNRPWMTSLYRAFHPQV